jgi:ATP synthase protein I
MTDENDKLKELEQKIAAFKKQDEKPAFNPNNTSSSLAMRVVTDLAAGLLVGGVIGYFLDKAFATSPLFLVILLFLGMAAGFMNLYRSLDKDSKADK